MIIDTFYLILNVRKTQKLQEKHKNYKNKKDIG